MPFPTWMPSSCRTLLVAMALCSAAGAAPDAPPRLPDPRDLIARETFWDNRDSDWFVEHVPSFECPDADLQTTWWYRFELLTKHLTYGSPGTGYVFTEFLDRPFWSGAYGAISCPAGHQLAEARWLRKPAIARDYARYWVTHPGAQPRNYSTWLAHAVWGVHLVHPARGWLDPAARRDPADLFPTDIRPRLAANTAAWREKHFVPATGLFWQVGHDDGMEFNIASRQTRDILRGAPSYRPSFNAYQFADLRALGDLHDLAGDAAAAAACRAEAERLRERTEALLWDERRGFFLAAFRDDESADGHTVRANSRIYDSGRFAGSPHGRELIGYVPWQFDMPSPDRGYERAWRFLTDPAFFAAPFGPTTVERHDPQFVLQPGCCWWSGQSWPYATTQTLAALARVLQFRGDEGLPVTARDYVDLLATFARTHRRLGRPYLAEACHPDTGSFAGHDAFNHSEHYFHSAYADLVVTGLMGLVPRDDDMLEVRPLLPAEWDYCCLDRVVYRGREIAILWDRTGARYGLGPGLHLVADGRRIGGAARPERVTAPLPPLAPSAPLLDDGLRPGLVPVPVNHAVTNDGGYFPRVDASDSAPGRGTAALSDGVAWYLRSPPNRWESSVIGAPATIDVDFGLPRRLDTVRLFILDDDPATLAGTADAALPDRDTTPSLVRAPARIELLARQGDAWVSLPLSARRPATPSGHRANHLAFPATEITRLRVVLVPQPGCLVGLSEVEAWGAALLPLPPAPLPAGNLALRHDGDGGPEFPRASASHTSRYDRVERANDGVVSFQPHPANRWTAYESPSPTDWLALDFGTARKVARVELAIYDDRGGVQPPERYHVEQWDGAAWLPVVGETHRPQMPTGGTFNEARFTPVETTRIRVVFTHRGAARSGVSEIFAWGE